MFAAWMGIAAAMACSGEPLEAVMMRMDAAAKQFHSFSANMKRTDVTAVLNETDVSSGSVRMRKNKGSVSGVFEFTEPEKYTIYITGHTAQRYFPKANVVEIYDTAKYTSLMDAYLLLGFGTPTAELTKSYDIKAAGEEKIGGVNTTHIELTPKTADVQKLIRKIDLWIPDGQSNPIQEKVIKASKDTLTVSYSDLKINPDLPDSAFELKLPAGVKKLTPNK